tara:strand:- start:265 stop:459 length:195 start_codon:yes stop_codon:yes gene_type:complete
MPSAWIDHVKKVAKDKKIPYNQALKVAGTTWKGGKAKADPKKAKASHKMPDGTIMKDKDMPKKK